jgi:hypothetical protein
MSRREDDAMRAAGVLLLAVGVLGVLGCSSESNPQAESAALEAAEAWVKIVDSGDYEASWNHAAEFFKGAVTRMGWRKNMESVREPLGANISREVKSKRYRTSLPGAPDGEYVVIQFKSSFANKKSAVETVTPMLDKDGTWRVSGYYIK